MKLLWDVFRQNSNKIVILPPAVFPRRVRRTADPSASLGMTKGMTPFSSKVAVERRRCLSPWMEKSTFCPATTFHQSATIPFVIPSEAEGSAVLRTRRGKTAGGRMTILLEF
jgi:hypothetical protein